MMMGMRMVMISTSHNDLTCRIQSLAAPANIYPEELHLNYVYRVAFFDFQFSVSEEDSLYAKFWLAVSVALVWLTLGGVLALRQMCKGKGEMSDSWLLNAPSTSLMVSVLTGTLYVPIINNLLQWVDCSPNGNVLVLDSVKNKTAPYAKCWTPEHRPYGAFALTVVVLYVLSANIMSPFFSEDFTGNTQLHFPVLYTIWTRTSALLIVLVRTFATEVHWAYLVIIMAVSAADAIVLMFSQRLLRVELCHVKWFKYLKAGVSSALAWSAFCSLIQGTLPNREKEFAPFCIMVTGWAVVCIIWATWFFRYRRNPAVISGPKSKPTTNFKELQEVAVEPT